MTSEYMILENVRLRIVVADPEDPTRCNLELGGILPYKIDELNNYICPIHLVVMKREKTKNDIIKTKIENKIEEICENRSNLIFFSFVESVWI